MYLLTFPLRCLHTGHTTRSRPISIATDPVKPMFQVFCTQAVVRMTEINAKLATRWHNSAPSWPQVTAKSAPYPL